MNNTTLTKRTKFSIPTSIKLVSCEEQQQEETVSLEEVITNCEETCIDRLKKQGSDYITYEEEAVCDLQEKASIDKALVYANLAIADQLKEINKTLKLLVSKDR